MRIAALTATALVLGCLGTSACSPQATTSVPVDGGADDRGSEGAPVALISGIQALGLPGARPSAALPGSPEWQATSAEMASYRQAIAGIQALLETGTPSQQLAALLLSADNLPVAPERVLEVSLPAAGSDPLLASVALLVCSSVADCPRERLLAVTENLALEDASLQLLRMELVDTAGHPALWEAASQAARLGDPIQPALALMLDSTHSLPTTSVMQQVRAEQAVARATASLMPTLLRLSQHCPQAHQVSEQVLQCRRLALLATQSPALLTAGLGVGIMRRQALDATQAAYWAEQYRQLQWLTQAGVAVLGGPHDTSRFVQDWARLGERQAFVGLLQRAGLPVLPPTGWKPGMPIPSY